MTRQLRPSFAYGYVTVLMSVRRKGGCRAWFRDSYSVNEIGTRGERNRLDTAQFAQEGSVIAVERPGCSAEGSKQGIDQLLLHYTGSHGFLHARQASRV